MCVGYHRRSMGRFPGVFFGEDFGVGWSQVESYYAAYVRFCLIPLSANDRQINYKPILGKTFLFNVSLSYATVGSKKSRKKFFCCEYYQVLDFILIFIYYHFYSWLK